jgi:formamidopyrimidine-DNA glycosylase
MPELPEVETYRRYIDRYSLHRSIQAIEVKNKITIKGFQEDQLRSAIVGSEFVATARHGKHLLVELSGGGWLTWHFGMTGEPVYFHDREEEPRYDRFLFSFDRGFLAFDDPRLLGRIGLTSSVEEFVERRRLGPDALAVDEVTFDKILERSRGAVKGFLMDQHKLAGLGNIYSDEVLFQARIDPRSDCRHLSVTDVRSLYRAIQDVLDMSIRNRTDFSKFPSRYLLHSRKKGSPCPLCGGTLGTITIGGRTTYYCPQCQVWR